MDEGSPLFTRASLSDWSFNNGHLYFHNRMFIPPSARSALLHSIHSSPLSGHLGGCHTKVILEQDFWWPGLSTFGKHPVVPPLLPIKSDGTLPFKQLSVDLITNLPPSAGFDSVMVVVDHGLTKGVILAPCHKTIDAAGIAQLFLTLYSNVLVFTTHLSRTVALSSLQPSQRN